MRALITGAGGQLGLELLESAPISVEVIALDHAALDITDQERVNQSVADHRPDVIINAAAYTAVDRAEKETDSARSVNGDAVGNLMRAAADGGTRLIHISTDFVFGGSATKPYRPRDGPDPQSVYGASKLEGEMQALESSSSTVIRVSRLYSIHADNFVTTMLRLMREREQLEVVDDQTGSPTWARDLAGVLWRFADHPELTGIWHWSDGGSCTWHRWALTIQKQAVERGLLKRAVPIEPVPTSGYPAPAKRPAYSVLNSSATCAALDVRQVPWEVALGTMLDQMAKSTAS